MFEVQFNDQAFGAALQHSFGWSDGQTQTQAVSKSAVVAVKQQHTYFRNHTCNTESF